MAKAKILSSVSPGLKAAEKNTAFMQNNCGQNQHIYPNRGKVAIIAPSGNIYERKMISGRKRKIDRGEAENMMNKRKRGTRVIDFTVPEFSEFIQMFNGIYVDKLLEYEFGYDRLQLLYPPCSLDSASNIGGDYGMGSSSIEEDNTKYAFKTYCRAINRLINGEIDKAVSKLESLSEREEMPHAQYALAIIKFKDLFAGKATKCEEDKKSVFLVSKVIKWLNDMELDNYLRPLNWSLLLKVQQYNIGGYGEEVKLITGLNVNDLLYKVLHSTKDTAIKFSNKLVKENSLVLPGELTGNSENRKLTKDTEFLVRCAMCELLKQKVSQDDLRGEYFALEDAFLKISKLPQKMSFPDIFGYVRAEIMYVHAIYLLMHKVGEDNGKKGAIILLHESCKRKHPGALYLRGVLLCNRKDFGFVSSNLDQFEECFHGLKLFAEQHKNEMAACMTANEYLRSDSFVRQRNKEEAERGAEEVLRKSGWGCIWEDWKANQQASGRLADEQRLNSISANSNVL